MKPEMGRRMFFGTMAAGLPLLALWTPGLDAQGRAGTAPHDHGGATVATDPVIDQLVKEIGRIHNTAPAGPRGEQARAFAAHLRTFSAYAKATGLDARLRTAASDVVSAQGRDTVLYAETDKSRVRRELEQRGFRVDNRLLTRPFDADYLTRSAALDELLSRGISPTLDRSATVLTNAAPELDRLAASLVRIQDAAYWQGYCDSIWHSYMQTQAQAGATCFIAEYLGFVGPTCVAMQATAMTFLTVWTFNCGGRY